MGTKPSAPRRVPATATPLIDSPALATRPPGTSPKVRSGVTPHATPTATNQAPAGALDRDEVLGMTSEQVVDAWTDFITRQR